MNIFRVATFLSLAVAPAAPADDQSIYESFSDISIGRVFFTSAERALLDARRNNPPQTGTDSGRQLSSITTAKNSRSPAGYIVNASGKSSRWHDGDFVGSATESLTAMKFPGDIDIVRHPVAGLVDDSANESKEPDTGARAPARDGDE